MFIDETVIKVKAGDGGNGCFSYERLKYKPKGRPNGGSGGRGGHVYVQGSVQAHTLQDVSYHRSYKAERGEHGRGSDQFGKNGKDVIIPIPLGTILYDDETGSILFDCIKAGQKIVVAAGGRGGKGNGALANARNPIPQHADEGRPGEIKTIRLSLKVLADVGLVGRPNAGKSTFLSIISHAHPKIADYPFTTTYPHLGIVKLHKTYDSFVVADIPGLIEGSHTGKGLGIRFLKHIERTKILAIMVEASSEDPRADAKILLNELAQYSPVLAEKPKCFILTKTDLFTNENCPKVKGWYPISSVTKTGVDKLITKLKQLIDSVKEEGAE